MRSTRTAAPGVKNPPGPTGLGQIMARTKGMAPGPDGTLAGQTLGGGGGGDGGGGGNVPSPVPYVPPLATSGASPLLTRPGSAPQRTSSYSVSSGTENSLSRTLPKVVPIRIASVRRPAWVMKVMGPAMGVCLGGL